MNVVKVSKSVYVFEQRFIGIYHSPILLCVSVWVCVCGRAGDVALTGRSQKAVSSFFLSGYSQHSLASIAGRERWESAGQEAGTGTPPLEAGTSCSALISEQSPLSKPWPQILTHWAVRWIQSNSRNQSDNTDPWWTEPELQSQNISNIKTNLYRFIDV